MKLHRKLFWLLVFLLPIQLGRHFWPESSFLLGLKIDYLSPTLFLTDVLIFLILVLWFLQKIRTFKKPYLVNLDSSSLSKLFLILSLFIFLVVSSLLARNQAAAFYKLLKMVEFILLGFYIFKNKISFINIRLPLSLSVIYSSLIAVFQFVKQGSLNGLFWFLGERTFNISTPGIARAILNGQLILRPYGTFSHPNALAGFLLVALILIIPYLKGALRWLTLILGTTTIIISFSRSAWLIGLLLCLLLILFIKSKKLKITFFITSIFLLIAFFFFASSFSTNEALFQRIQLIQASVLMFKNFPFSGVGLNNFIVYLPDFWPLTGFTYFFQPVHNIYLLVLAELGFLGLVLFLWFLFLCFKKFLKIFLLNKGELNNLSWFFFLSFLVILLLGFFDHYWLTLQQNQLLLTLVLGLIWSSKTEPGGLSLN